MRTLLFLISSLILTGCSETSHLKSPTNLTINVVVSNDGSGDVSVFALANDAKFYKFFFGDVSNENPGPSIARIVTHQYKSVGTYVIKVQAHADEEIFISESKEVFIDFSFPIPTMGYSTPQSYEGMNLLWQDEFSGNVISETNWTFETGTGCPNCGWGNNELQFYRKENASIVDGNLIITAKSEASAGSNYTSSRMITKNKLDFKYGRVDVRAVLPKGQGIWPAIWMLGSNISTVGWPACGEVDIMELVGGGPGKDNKIYGTVHWDDGGQYASYGGNTTLSSGIFNDEFHVFSIIWDETKIVWLLDDIQFHVIDITPAGLSEFRENFFLILNLAVGGNWPGSPNSTTVFPQRFIVDYVRVFQKI